MSITPSIKPMRSAMLALSNLLLPDLVPIVKMYLKKNPLLDALNGMFGYDSEHCIICGDITVFCCYTVSSGSGGYNKLLENRVAGPFGLDKEMCLHCYTETDQVFLKRQQPMANFDYLSIDDLDLAAEDGIEFAHFYKIKKYNDEKWFDI